MTARLPFAAPRDPCELVAPAPTLDDALAELTAEVRAMRRDMALLLARGDPLVALLPLIYDAVGDSVFSATDLAALALLPGRVALAAALAPLLRGRGLRSLGKALARHAGNTINGHKLVRVGADRAGVLWLVQRV